MVKKLTFGTPEKLVPSKFCDGFKFKETDIKYDTNAIQFYNTARGCCLRLPIKSDEQIYGLGLQLKAFNLRGRKFTVRPNADPKAPNGDSHAPAPFFVSTAGYGIYIDTARYAEFHFGAALLNSNNTATYSDATIGVNTDQLYSAKNFEGGTISIQIPVAQGVDIYIIEGETITDIVAQYNMLTGRATITNLIKRNSRNGLVEVTIQAYNQKGELVLTDVTEAIVKCRLTNNL